MKISTKLLTIMFVPVFIVACGGGGGGGGGSSTPAPTPTVETIDNTQDIVAERDFSFDIGETITISMNYQGSADGALHLYTKAAFTTENGVVVADPMSRITTIYPTRTSEVELEVNGNWSQLYAQWVPMSANESEKNWVVSLNQSNNNYHLDF
ncbi:conserved hypothetical protein [Vibrio jasicida]|uniref:PLAT domain-containing protein n=1 Tax=Vibrio jasicida TaxID=766224 RepID=A0AAU9QKC0_9VIBR|nr:MULTISPECIES: hypothetical protein [Vibrio]CAH1586531.1 conserved hypothetical protein [Vibrio rotiferianus]MCF6453000.1 hypothetical protein [Vibrio sp. MMG023]PMO42574.1 hypothetical protein BCT11_09885 [Vibrio sp. 10N.222.52.B12]CAH1541397.1 conserved hypothetical protein [Vibrio jasicida]CAH1575259.1 conserved hypothetical protein [Vibrio jasicida]